MKGRLWAVGDGDWRCYVREEYVTVVIIRLTALVTKPFLPLPNIQAPSVLLAGPKHYRGDHLTISSLGEVECAVFQPLFSLVQLILNMALTVALSGCGHSASRIQRTWTR